MTMVANRRPPAVIRRIPEPHRTSSNGVKGNTHANDRARRINQLVARIDAVIPSGMNKFIPEVREALRLGRNIPPVVAREIAGQKWHFTGRQYTESEVQKDLPLVVSGELPLDYVS